MNPRRCTYEQTEDNISRTDFIELILPFLDGIQPSPLVHSGIGVFIRLREKIHANRMYKE